MYLLDWRFFSKRTFLGVCLFETVLILCLVLIPFHRQFLEWSLQAWPRLLSGYQQMPTLLCCDDKDGWEKP